MLALKPNCELCNKNLPPESNEACICSYECTFCKDCVDTVLFNVCPNCGGGFTMRPIRPRKAFREGVSLVDQPASTQRVNTDYSKEEIDTFVRDIRHIVPEKR